MSVGSPLMCAECGYLHGHHAVSCERQRMTGEQLYHRMQARIDDLMANVDPRERHKHTGKIIHAFCEMVHAMAQPALWREFNDALHAHDYHRHIRDGE